MSLVARELEAADYHKGFLGLLSQLTVVGTITEAAFAERLEHLKRLGDYLTVVVEDTSTGKIAATATLVVERKFVHQCGLAGHVEDVVVDAGYRGQKLGQRVVERLLEEAQARNCYKVILNCTDANAPFYAKCGFTRKDVQMAKYLNSTPRLPSGTVAD
ncbi:hypothetical protein WJX72_000631 [[Myrmecia] bisecta]|uniref:Glucosamine 6-phosphate N-acetyltransferase n=1 Tax=[Myrmecia] bisecta TaxID=41462 RepID=A0AAW1PMV9_9CHLO